MSGGTARLWRNSATLVILSRNALMEKSRVFDYRLLLLQRSAKSRFMPGNYVFPGGVIEKVDFDNQWMDLYKKSFTTFGRDFSNLVDIKGPSPPIYKKSNTSVPTEVAFRICAIREAFEESGVLLLKKIPDIGSRDDKKMAPHGCIHVVEDLSEQEISQWRTEVHSDPSKFIDLCRMLNSIPDVWSLSEWSNWLTPADLKIRFDTVFYICFCDHQPLAQHDDQETVHSEWKTPTELIVDYYSNKTRLAPPQLYTVMQLLRFTKWDELKAFQENRAKDGMTRLLTIRVKCKDAVIALFPGDDMYPQVYEHMGKITNNEYGIKDDIVPQQEFTETSQGLEEGIVNFHRIIVKPNGERQVKMNCTTGNNMPIPLNMHEILTLIQGDSKL